MKNSPFYGLTGFLENELSVLQGPLGLVVTIDF
jgi:hypothetical protein